MDNAPIEGKYSGDAICILIDEAHTIFKEKKSQDFWKKYFVKFDQKEFLLYCFPGNRRI